MPSPDVTANPSAIATGQPSASVPSQMPPDPLLHRVYSLFGLNKTLLVPVQNDSLISEQWFDYTIQQSKDPANQSVLEISDLAVKCGPQSHGLAAIMFSEEARRALFLKQNPLLQNTLLTSFESNYLVWMRVKGWKPGDYVHPYFNWIHEGCVMVADRAPVSSYHFDNQSEPVAIHFKQIQWHLNIEECLLGANAIAYLRASRIQRPKGPGRPKANDDYIASVFLNQHGDIHFDPKTKTFYRKMQDNGRIYPLYVEEVKMLLYQTLVSLKEHHATGNAAIHVDTRPRDLARLVPLLKILTVRRCKMRIAAPPPPPTEELETFEAFIASCFERSRDHSVTLGEAYDEYRKFCISRGCVSQYSERQFSIQLWQAMNRKFSLAKRHDIMRDGKAKRGFRHLRCKANADPNFGIIPDGSDAPPDNITGSDHCSN